MICNDFITCARYYDHKTSCFRTLFNKDPSIFWTSTWFFFVTNFQNCGSEHDHGLLWIKDAPIHGINTNEKIKMFVNKYISCNVSLLPITLQNAQQHQHTSTYKKKSHVIGRFHYPLPPMNEKKKLEPFELKKTYLLTKKCATTSKTSF